MEVMSSLIGTLGNFVFTLVVRIFDIILMPFVAILTALIPDISTFYNYIVTFITDYIVPYIKFGVSVLYNLIGLNPNLVALVVTYFIFIFTAKYTMVAINFAINVYQKLKP